jgi:hypothetical protein
MPKTRTEIINLLKKKFFFDMKNFIIFQVFSESWQIFSPNLSFRDYLTRSLMLSSVGACTIILFTAVIIDES